MNWIKNIYHDWRDGVYEDNTKRKIKNITGGVVALYLVCSLALGWYWSREPDVDITLPGFSENDEVSDVVGETTTKTVIGLTRFLLEKPGGFISNDVLPPGLLLDNMPNWEYGVLIQVRDATRALRESFSRSQSQSKEDVALSKAEPRLNFSNNSWMLPASESQYKEALGFLDDYLSRLEDPNDQQAQFYARADNLRYWLRIVESRLGSLSQRLSASVGQRRLNTDLSNDVAASQSTAAENDIDVKTPWLEIDDVFYESRGSTWALIQLLRAMEVDFRKVLQNKNAMVSYRQIIRELEATQQALYSPVILNGSGFGLFANHSLVMTSYISRANAAIIDLRALLAQG